MWVSFLPIASMKVVKEPRTTSYIVYNLPAMKLNGSAFCWIIGNAFTLALAAEAAESCEAPEELPRLGRRCRLDLK